MVSFAKNDPTINMILRNNLHWKYLSFIFLLSLTACLDLDEIPFIDFRANFETPAFARAGQTINLQADQQSAGAFSHEWYITELDATFQGKKLSFQFDSAGQYTIRLVSSIEKSIGLLRDTSTKSISVLPLTESFISQQSYGDLTQDEFLQDVLVLPNDEGYYLFSSKQLNILEIRKLDINGQEEWQTEFPNITRGRIENIAAQLLTDQKILVSGGIQVSPSESDAFIVELRDMGTRAEIQWQQVISSVESEFFVGAFPLSQQDNTGYMAVGSVASGGQATILIDRYSLNGDMLSTTAFDNVCTSCQANSIFVIPGDGGNRIIVAGQESGSPALFEFVADDDELLFRNKLVLKQLEGQANRVIQLSDGKFVMAGELTVSLTNSSQAFIAKLEVIDQEVVPIWLSQLNIFQESFNDIQEGENGEIWASGVHFNPLSNEDVVLARFNNTTGELEDSDLLGTNVNEGVSRLLLQNGEPVIFGYIEDNTALALRDIHISR